MIKQDEIYNGIIAKIAKDNSISIELANEIVQAYFESIGNLIQDNKPYSIKMDFFGKIRTTEGKFEYSLMFQHLKKVNETI